MVTATQILGVAYANLASMERTVARTFAPWNPCPASVVEVSTANALNQGAIASLDMVARIVLRTVSGLWDACH